MSRVHTLLYLVRITSELEHHIKRYGSVRFNIEALKAVVIRMSACARMSHLR